MQVRGAILLGSLLMVPLARAAVAEPAVVPPQVSVDSTSVSAFAPDDSTLASTAPAMSVEDEPESPATRSSVAYPVTDVPLDEVRWLTPKKMALADVASGWGMHGKVLRKLNPGLNRRRKIPAGTSLVVFQRDDAKPPRSVGAPNKGRLRNGVPLPEGDHWRLRQRRARAYGSEHSVEALVMALEAYGEAFPDSEPVRLGDLSARNGGRLSPHVSHRTGRDVDIGYVLKPGTRGDRYWQSANEKTFDVEKNWFLIRALIETGRVQRIFLSGRLQRQLMARARTELSDAEMQRYFRPANPDPTTRSIIRHWRGHRDHMHVRFTCEPENRSCVSRSVGGGA